jgi:hypothetical protein
MEILRVPPYLDIDVDFKIPAGYPVEKTFTATILDMADLSVSEQTFDGITNDIFTVVLDGQFDNDYHVVIRDEDEVKLLDTVYELRRPYVDPRTKGETASDVAKYTEQEELARAIIDSVISDGFYYTKRVVETTGQGTDYLPIWVDAKRVHAVYENNTLIDQSVREFRITSDKTAVIEYYADPINRDESARILLPSSPTDFTELDFSQRGFPRTWDYRLILEVGYPEVPSDIVRATELLMHDIDCGKLDYYKRYISAYNTDQFRIQFDKAVFEGTGNLIVDKILSRYIKTITNIGVL